MVFIEILRFWSYCFHQRGGFDVMGMRINFLFNQAPPRSTPRVWGVRRWLEV
ncbi:unnamed protein product [Hymenolepis diminuta]|uniref:Uncharacterized protein n=1 Tax=Hymenolepis diminuta TaxID=6216 RepID=A0A564Z3D4_HYMDI|nr:unnamed protein product [Hymenolepis diminuta]